MAEHNITLFEACEILNKSKKSVSRYIRRGRLNPQKVKSLQGTLEYRFTKDDIDALQTELARPDKTGQTRQDTPPLEKADLHIKPSETAPGKTRQDRQDKTGQASIILLLKDTIELLKGQLTIKDTQIGTLNSQVHKFIERSRETNILLNGLQNRLMLSEPPQDIKTRRDGTGRSGAELARRLVLIVLLLLTLALFFYTTPIAGQSLKLFYESLTR